eukprot:10852352-Ditylum_brightwellii.AAC.1
MMNRTIPEMKKMQVLKKKFIQIHPQTQKMTRGQKMTMTTGFLEIVTVMTVYKSNIATKQNVKRKTNIVSQTPRAAGYLPHLSVPPNSARPM